MRRLFIADVHGNLPAFRAALEAAGAVDEIVFLGDVTEFGPRPSECVDLLRSLNAKAILGNHDQSTLSRVGKELRLGPPVDWCDWVCAQLRDDQIEFLASLPTDLWIDSCGRHTHVIHYIPGNPYLRPSMTDGELTDYFTDVPGEAVYCGHSHKLVDRVVGDRRFVCFRSIGQCRDRDYRAGYAIEEDGVLRHFRAEYDVASVVRDIMRIGMDESFARRYSQFISTGYDREWSRSD